MQLVLNEDQQMLAKSASDWVADRSPLSRVRTVRDDATSDGYSRELWREMAELGWAGIPFSEELGGLGLGIADVVVVTEALGRGLVPEPFLSSVMLAGQTLALAGSEEQRAAWLAPIIEGSKVVALAYQEAASRYDLTRVETRAEADGDGFRLTGEKVQVIDGWAADALIVVARTSGEAGDAAGLSMFLIDDLSAAGVEVIRQHRVDSRNAALVRLDGASVPAGALIGTRDGAGDVLEQVVERASVALAGEMLGAMTEAFERTLAYLKERTQFGVQIGSFQALKHRAAKLYIEIELARSAVMAAARALDAGTPLASALASAAQARVSDAFVLIANEAIQMHGGIGMTDEHDIGFFLKRARVAEMTFGDAAHHRDRFARLMQF